MKDQCIYSLQYDQWANLKLLDHIEQLPEDVFDKPMNSVFPTIAETFYHIFRGKRIWFKRSLPHLVMDESITDFHNIPHAKESFVKLHNILIEAVHDHYENLDVIVYQSPKGNTFQNQFHEIIFHLANHGTYHRGNIAAMIRECGYKGTSTDYIQFLRDTAKNKT
ncbi:DinB family protein [Niallia sp. XMNu-256]|uniref:DinB family protein n=1 Tax=Niallia sp. XMNu-256 TaxID=3082444 RepID=UPI0030CE96C9